MFRLEKKGLDVKSEKGLDAESESEGFRCGELERCVCKREEIEGFICRERGSDGIICGKRERDKGRGSFMKRLVVQT